MDQPEVEVQVQLIMWSVQLGSWVSGGAGVIGMVEERVGDESGEDGLTYAAIPASSALPGSGTVFGLGLRVKVRFEASSSWSAEVPLLVVTEGAVSLTIWLTPDFVSSPTVFQLSDGLIVEGAIAV